MIALYWPLSGKLVNRREQWPPAISIRVVLTLHHLPGQKWLLHNSNPEFVTWQIHVERFRGMHTKSERELQPTLQNLAGKMLLHNSNRSLYQTHVYMGSDLWVLVSVSPCFWYLTDVTLADEDTNSILTDDANRATPGNMAMQVAPPGGQI